MSDIQEIAVRSVGIEVSKTQLSAVCLDPGGEITATKTAPVDYARPSSEQVIEFVDALKDVFGPFTNVGVAIPGLVAQGGRAVAFSAHIPEHSGLDLASAIEAATGTRAIVENDANAAAYGEYRLGAGRGGKNLFYATLGTGVGGALIFDGEIWRGAGGFAGEFGYVTINSEGMRLEDVASSANIIRRTRSRFHQDNTSSLVDLDETAITIQDIVSAAAAEDDFAKLMLERTGGYVGTGIATVINLLNIERIVIGGEIMQAKQVLLEAIITRARELSFGPSFASTEILATELGLNAPAAGAALLSSQIV